MSYHIYQVSRICERCKTTKPLDQFALVKGVAGEVCKSCKREERAFKRQENELDYLVNGELPTKLTKKRKATPDQHLQRTYGITLEDKVRMLAEQQDSCAVCFIPLLPSTAVVDHCHYTGKLRGILCTHCNLLLGHAKDQPQILRNAAEYLVSRLA